MKRYLSLMILFGLSLSAFAQDGKARKSDGTACTAFPCVVASVSLTDQTVAVSQTALFTPTTSGLFRLTFYLESSAIKGSSWGFSSSWTDDLKTRSTGTFQAYRGTSPTYIVSFRDVTGQPITYTVTEGANAGGTTYDLFITVEQLQ